MIIDWCSLFASIPIHRGLALRMFEANLDPTLRIKPDRHVPPDVIFPIYNQLKMCNPSPVPLTSVPYSRRTGCIYEHN